MRLHFLVASGVLASASLLVSSLSPQAWADTFTVSVLQSGKDVVAAGSGTLSVSGSVAGSANYVGVRPDPGFLVLGGGQASVYTGVAGPSSIGSSTGSIEGATSSMGGLVGIDTGKNEFFVPLGYVAGTTLTSSDTRSNTTLQGLELTPGSYSYTLGSGDTFIINIGSPTSVSPEPSSVALLGTGLLALGGVVRKRLT